MDRRNTLGTALVVLAVVLFAVPTLFPVQSVLTHDTSPGTFDGRDDIESQGIEIVAYENLSDRGQEVYHQALEHDGEYRTPLDRGARDFEYPTTEDLAQAYQRGTDERPDVVAIERPDDASLPPADEPARRMAPDAERDNEHAERAQRYDLMTVSQGPPPLGATSQLLRLAAAALAVVSLGVGGYLLSSKGS